MVGCLRVVHGLKMEKAKHNYMFQEIEKDTKTKESQSVGQKLVRIANDQGTITTMHVSAKQSDENE